MNAAAAVMNLLARSLGWLNFSPVAARGKNVHVVYFGVFAGLAAVLGILVVMAYLGGKGFVPRGGAVAFPLVVVAMNWLGARLFHLVALGRKLLANPRKYLLETGFYVQGGIAGVALSGVFGVLWLDAPVLVLLDALAWGGILALVVGRLGCYNYGCCYGRPTDLPWGCRYEHPGAKVLRLKPHYRHVALHPTQLYTAALNLVMFVVLGAVAVAGVPDGVLASMFLVYHGAARLLFERFRDDINFDDGRNWFTSHIARLTLGAGVLLAATGMTTGAFGGPTTPLSAANLFGLVFARWDIVLVALASGCLMFVGYGIHGRTLGSFR